MSWRKRRRSWQWRCQWEKDKKRWLWLLCMKPSNLAAGLSSRTVTWALASWKTWCLFFILTRNNSSMKTSACGSLVNLLTLSLSLSCRILSRSLMKLPRVLGLDSSKHSPLWSTKTLLIKSTILSGEVSFSLCVSCTRLWSKGRSSVQSVGVCLMSLTTLIWKPLWCSLKSTWMHW